MKMNQQQQDIGKVILDSVDALIRNIMPNVPINTGLQWNFLPHQIVITVELPPLGNLDAQPDIPI